MGWADQHIKKLQAGETVKFRPRGRSMEPKIMSGQLVTVAPADESHLLKDGDIVLCKVNGNQYLHIADNVRHGSTTTAQIRNNKGRVNGWCDASDIYGVLIAKED